MYVCMYVFMYVCTYMYVWIDGWMAGWMDGWMDVLVYYIQVGYSGQSDIVARKWWTKVAIISELHCNTQ